MINAEMRVYDYFTYGEKDAYAQAKLSDTPQGKVKMAVYPITQSVSETVRFKDSTYIGLTAAAVNDNCVIAYGAEKLKVLYVMPKGRLKQVYMKNI